MKYTFVGLFLLLTHPLGWAAVTDCSQVACRYVRAGASGSGTSWSDAMNALPATLVRGTTYFIADGTYAGRTFNTAVSGTTPIIIKKAIATDHGTNTGWTADMGDGQAIFNSGFVFTTSNYEIDGQTGGGAENNFGGLFGIKIIEKSNDNALLNIAQNGTGDNITIRHVDLEGKGSVSTSGGSYSNDGMAVYGASNITLSYFRMKGIGRGPFFLSGKNITVEHGHVESFYGSEAVHSEVASIWGFDGSVGDMTFRYNLITDIQSTGGIMWDNSSNKAAKLSIYGNVFYKPAGKVWGEANGVIGGWTGGGGEQFHNVKVYNNTFINVDQASLSTNPNIFSGNEAYNNIFYNCDAPSFNKFAAHDYNLFINSGTVQGEPNGKVGSGVPFANMSAYDFRLVAATSPGMSLSSPMNIDFQGKLRGADGIVDRGAFEYSGPISTTPVTLVAPSNLRLVSASSSSLQIQFDYSGTGQSGFAVSRKTGSTGSYSEIASLSSLSLTDSGLAASTQYCYKVEALSSTLRSAASNELCATTAAASAPAPTPAPAPTTGENLLGSTVPVVLNDNDGSTMELGMKFKALKSGKISAIRFYKSPSESGVHTGKIYSSTGSLLAKVDFTNESASGWQQMSLSSPLSIAANTEYVVSVNTPNNYYVSTQDGLASTLSSANLQSVGVGLYGPVGAMPTSTWGGSSYFRDIVFTADSTVVSPTPAPAPAPAVSENLLGTSAPAAVNKNDGVNYELGMKIKILKAGKISAIRFYKGSSETGTRTGKIYSSTGTLLASVTFSSLSASGWQVANLSTPLSVAAGAVVVVTVNTGAKYYVTSLSDLATVKSSASLETVGGGLFGAVGAMPTKSYMNSNYFRDIVFTPNP